MPNPAMQLIKTITVGAGGASSIDFSSIPQTGFTDLVVTYSIRDAAMSGTTNNLIVALNGVTTSATQRTLRGTGTSVSSTNDSPIYVDQGIDSGLATANAFGNGQLYIPNYAGNTVKLVSGEAVTETAGSGASQVLTHGLWSSTAAINRIELRPNGSTWVEGSTASLYGIASTAAAALATGGAVMKSGDYVYHVFTASGTFTPTKALTADVLIIAGGGGGGVGYAGGGGAGGYVYTAAQSLTATPYTVAVGAGGARGDKAFPTSPFYAFPSNGGNSSFTGLTTAIGGGIGGGRANGNEFDASSGGSGGGGDNESFPRTGGAGTAGQGNAGGNGSPNNYYAGGGGGGAGGVGASAGNSYAGVPGGIGLNTLASWAAATGTGHNGYYAGGGGGGMSSNGPAGTNPGGAGGGGYGGRSSDGTDGMANTGGGGGGGDNKGGRGGSGLVIVRYAA